jgi:D-inositol-3-phosphate glycosyltransferase
MRVAILSLHTSPLAPLGGRETGGMNVYVRHVAACLAAAGVEVDVFTRRTDPATPEVQPMDGARLVQVGAGPATHIEKEDLLGHVEEFARGVEAFRAREALDERAPDYDLIHSHYWLAVEAGDALARRWHVPHVAMFHTLGDVKLRARASEHESPARLEAERRLVHSVDHIVAATQHERQLLKQLYRVSPQRVSVIPLGVDLDAFRPRPRAEARAALGLPAQERGEGHLHVVLAVGRIEPLKGFDILIRAVAEMTERDHVRLIIVGGDDRAAAELDRLRAVAAEVGVLDAVTFTGAVPHETLQTYYSAADVVAVPSFYESFGLVAVEALASGVPVVASRVGGLTSTVADGRTGYLIPWRCPGPFAEKLDLLFENESLRAAFGAAAARSMQAYSWDAVAASLHDLYRDLAATPVSAAAAVAGDG